MLLQSIFAKNALQIRFIPFGEGKLTGRPFSHQEKTATTGSFLTGASDSYRKRAEQHLSSKLVSARLDVSPPRLD